MNLIQMAKGLIVWRHCNSATIRDLSNRLVHHVDLDQIDHVIGQVKPQQLGLDFSKVVKLNGR